jgi:hypothetical protein
MNLIACSSWNKKIYYGVSGIEQYDSINNDSMKHSNIPASFQTPDNSSHKTIFCNFFNNVNQTYL